MIWLSRRVRSTWVCFDIGGWLAPVMAKKFAMREDIRPAAPLSSPGQDAARAGGPRKGWLDWLKAHEPVVILEKTVRVYHITDPAPRTAR